MFAVVTHDRPAIDLWKSAPPSKAAEVRSGRSGCLTLDSWRVQPGVVSVAGREHGIFEHTFEVLLRGADGRVFAQHQGVHGTGHWSTHVRYRAARRQPLSHTNGAIRQPGREFACSMHIPSRRPHRSECRSSR